MYIRRKVFSKLQTEEGQEKYFSTTEFTRITEAEQREFAKKEEKKAPKKDAKKVMKNAKNAPKKCC